MPKITKIVAQTKDPSRVSVFIDDKFAFGLPRQVAADMNLKIGLELASNELESLQGTADDAKVYDRLLRLLTRRAHSKAELKRKLTAKGVAADVAARAVARAADSGYVNDTQFATDFACHGRDFMGWAPARTRLELRKRGIPSDIADSAISDAYNEVDLLDHALLQVTHRAAKLTGDRESRRRRLVSFLARRGYPTSICRKAVDEVAP